MLALVAFALLCAAGFALRAPGLAIALWLFALATSPDAWANGLVGGQEAVVAGLKGAGLLLAAVLALRCGARSDRWNPAFAFAAMFAAGLVHGLYPGLTPLASLRSAAGSMAPFLFGFVRLDRRLAATIERATVWAPLAAVAAAGLLAAAGLDPLFSFEQGALRLGGNGQPAFLAGFALIAIYAGLLGLLRQGGPEQAALVAVNFMILLLTGARAPLGLAALVLLGFCLLRGRVWLFAAAGAAISLAVLCAGALSALRVVDLFQLGEAGDLSNRLLVWPVFTQAIAAAPLTGWGVGAGKVIIPPASALARLIRSNAAHNEYLRIGAEGGVLGLFLLIACIILWVRRGTALLPAPERWFVRLVFCAFALHCLTDNSLIATTASAFFLWAAAVFAGARETNAASAPHAVGVPAIFASAPEPDTPRP